SQLALRWSVRLSPGGRAGCSFYDYGKALSQIHSRRLPLSSIQGMVSSGDGSDSYIEDGFDQMLLRRRSNNTQVSAVVCELIDGGQERTTMQLQIGMRINAREFCEGGKEPIVRIDTVNRKTDLGLTSDCQRRGSLFECPKPAEQWLHIRQQCLSSFGELRLSALHFKQRGFELILETRNCVADRRLCTIQLRCSSSKTTQLDHCFQNFPLVDRCMHERGSRMSWAFNRLNRQANDISKFSIYQFEKCH